jgi:hypothetical protein
MLHGMESLWLLAGFTGGGGGSDNSSIGRNFIPG